MGIDNFITGNPRNIAGLIGNENFRFVRHDVSDFIFVDGPVDAVLHFASPASPIDYLDHPIQTLKVGSLGTHNALGVAKAKVTWEFLYAYQVLEADAVFGLWTDSDFGGGGTDNSGSVFRGAYALSDKTNVAFSYFLNKIDENAGAEIDYYRLQLDLNFKY